MPLTSYPTSQFEGKLHFVRSHTFLLPSAYTANTVTVTFGNRGIDTRVSGYLIENAGTMWTLGVVKHQQGAFAFQLVKRQSSPLLGQGGNSAGTVKGCYPEPYRSAPPDKIGNAVRRNKDFEVFYIQSLVPHRRGGIVEIEVGKTVCDEQCLVDMFYSIQKERVRPSPPRSRSQATALLSTPSFRS